MRHERAEDQPDLHLFVPDELIVVDHRKEQALRYADFLRGGVYARAVARNGRSAGRARRAERGAQTMRRVSKADKVRTVIAGTQRGDFFEVVPSQVLSAGMQERRANYSRIFATNPSPYEFLINLGGEQQSGASPEMFVRVENGVETCPIAGTIRRGSTPIEDAEQILTLLNSQKDEAELTMCTDDRNDKARISKFGSVRVEGRRMIELYMPVHTVDYVTGELKGWR